MVLRAPLTAVAVLTRVPVGAGAGADLASAAPWFPVVGGLTGLGVAAVGLGSAAVWPAYVAAVLAVAAEVLLTGALHLDGLADCADGSGGHTRERRLAIMKDHAVGVYGAAAVVLALGLRTGCLIALLRWDAGGALAGIVAAWALSRAAMLPVALALPYARSEGTGRSVVEGLTPARCGAGVLLGLLPGAAVVPALGAVAVVAGLAGAVLGALLVYGWARTRLGGATGDVLGATAELALLGALLGLLVAS